MLDIMKNIILISILSILSSCSSKYIPPSRPLSELVANTSDDREMSALIISKLNSPDFSNCLELKIILENERHPLFSWLKAKQIELCQVSQSDIHKNALILEQSPKWAQEVLSDAIIKKSENEEDVINAVVKKVDFLKTQNEKIILLNDYLKKYKSESLSLKLIEIAPRFSTVLTAENIYKAAKDFERNREFVKARKIYQEIINSKVYELPLKMQAFESLRLSFNIERNKKDYLAQTGKYISFLNKNRNNTSALDKLFDVSLSQARIYWTIDDFVNAKKSLLNLKNDSQLTEKYEALLFYYLGGIFEDENNMNEALKNYVAAYELFLKVEDKDVIENRNDTLWNICWYLYKEGKFEESLNWINQYIPTADSTDHKFSYWRAKILKKLDRLEEYQEEIKKLRELDQYGFYGQMSYLDSGELSRIKPIKDEFEYKEDPLSWAIYCNLEDLAHSILDSNPKTTLKEYYVSKYFHKMIFKYFSLSPKDRENFDALIYSYPLAFKKNFIDSNMSKIVKPSLLMSIARQESAFNPFARSHAHAFGLLQLIPAQGERLSKKYKIEYKDYNDLYEVEKNIQLSSLLLEELILKLDRNFVNFVASYNAGESKVFKWRQRNPKLTEMEFIEQIPYKETRNYVKLVARNYLIYARQLSDESLKLTSRFFNFEGP